jgi:putative PIN family toxin of toxin-antitoxin system
LRAVLDPNVIISALLSPTGAPAQLILAWKSGRFELIVSDLLLAELERALGYPKLRRRISEESAQLVVQWLRRDAEVRPDPPDPPAARSVDPGDDYLIALAATEKALLVSGDNHLLGMTTSLPIVPPARFLARLKD